MNLSINEIGKARPEPVQEQHTVPTVAATGRRGSRVEATRELTTAGHARPGFDLAPTWRAEDGDRNGDSAVAAYDVEVQGMYWTRRYFTNYL